MYLMLVTKHMYMGSFFIVLIRSNICFVYIYHHDYVV